jgi:Tfp pilus assembly protein PilF
MPKRKKQKRKVQRSPNRPSAKLMRALTVAMGLYEEGEAVAARQQLSQLARQYPRSKPVLLALLEVSEGMQDWRTYAYYGEQLLPFERGEDEAETLNNLVYAYIQLLYPALAWQNAFELMTRHPGFEQIEQVKSFAETAESMLLKEVEATIESTAFTQDEKFKLMVLNDRVRFLTESGYSKDAIRTAETLLEKMPNMLPILNNLSLSQFMIGDIEQAITTSQNVITQDPGNCHALGNLVRYTFLTAQFDEAQAYAMRLQQITSDNPDLEVKQAEAFAFLGDDDQVWAAYERAREKDSEQTPLLLHLAAVASHRLGHEKKHGNYGGKPSNYSPHLIWLRNAWQRKCYQ